MNKQLNDKISGKTIQVIGVNNKQTYELTQFNDILSDNKPHMIMISSANDWSTIWRYFGVIYPSMGGNILVAYPLIVSFIELSFKNNERPLLLKSTVTEDYVTALQITVI